MIEIPRAQMEINGKLLWRIVSQSGPMGHPQTERRASDKDELTTKNYISYEGTNHQEGTPTDSTCRRISQIRIRDNRMT